MQSVYLMQGHGMRGNGSKEQTVDRIERNIEFQQIKQNHPLFPIAFEENGQIRGAFFDFLYEKRLSDAVFRKKMQVRERHMQKFSLDFEPKEL